MTCVSIESDEACFPEVRFRFLHNDIRAIALYKSLFPLHIRHRPSDERLKANGEAEPRTGNGKRNAHIMRILKGENPAKAGEGRSRGGIGCGGRI